MICKIINILILTNMCILYNIFSFDYLKNKIKNLIYKSDIIVIKFIQWLSMRPDLINNNLKNIFADFKDKFPPHPFKTTNDIIFKSFGKEIWELFDEFPKDSIASGSIAQVYKCKYINDPKYYAIKVKHPNIDNCIKDYKKFITFCLSFARYVGNININVDIMEFYKGIIEQTDFNNEADNSRRFYQIFSGSNVIVPKVHYNDENIIVYEFIESTKFDDYKYYNDYEKQKNKAIDFVASMYAPILLGNEFHADIHDGNWGITYDDKIVLYDYGFIRSLNRDLLIKILKASAVYDSYTTIFTLLSSDIVNFSKNLDKIKKYKFDKIILSRYCSDNLKTINTFINIFYDMKIKLNPSILNFVINSMVVETYVLDYKLDSNNNSDKIKNEVFSNLLNGSERIFKGDKGDQLIEIYSSIITHIDTYMFIQKEIHKLVEKLKIHNIEIIPIMENIIVALINTILIHSKLKSNNIIDILVYLESKIDRIELHDKIKKLIDIFNTYNKSMYLLLKLQHNLLIDIENINMDDVCDDEPSFVLFLSAMSRFMVDL